ncbi:oligoendopeptidase F [Parahaliea sp. F7430]|uniref:Oligopeptidase F n=1 Tax=Sediminihaliea albiluteola TaxID=2758564 RepID=A0A7W2YJJ1_9GAMM|nr:oligoendopeptidase F [Sediminihaliea albiluteola]MBA6413137.1 oligoendopeptidase F [Sediminihaliea albiluteola]
MATKAFFKTTALALGLSLSLTTLAQAPERSEIPQQYKWDLSAMYESSDAWEADVKMLQERIPDIEKYKGRLGEDGSTLLQAIQEYESLNRLLGRIYVYAGLKSFEDMRVGENSARYSRAQSLHAQLSTSTSFIAPELLAISPQKIDQMLEKTPQLRGYRHYLEEQSRMRPYTLSEEAESLLAQASEPLSKFSSVFLALDNADLSFGEIEDEQGNPVTLTKGLYGAAMSSADRRYREAAWKALFKEYEKHGNMLAANYEGHVKSRVFEAKIRGFDSALQSATYQSAIPEEVYHNLIRVAREGVEPLQRYLELRRKTLGLETLEVWDMYAPMVASDYGQIDFEDAKQIVAEALSAMGDDYLALYWQGFEEGWVDAFESAGKRGGAYSWGMYDSKPYLSLNYSGTLNDVSTLAHEYGHSIHSYLTRNTQPYIYGSYRTFIAEIASMTNEAILFQSLMAKADSPRKKAYLLQNYLDQFRSGFFRQTSLADFEMQAHAKAEAGEALTKESLNALYAEVFKAYYGDAVHADPLNASEWSRIPHLLRTDNFYVYQYATSFVAANALASKIIEEGETARERFLTMLRAGSSDYPIELLKAAGVDMTTSEPIYAALEVFEALVDELEESLKQL